MALVFEITVIVLNLFSPWRAQILRRSAEVEIVAGNQDSGPESLGCHHPVHDQQTLPPGVRSHPLHTPDGQSHSGSDCSEQLWKLTSPRLVSDQ